MTYSSSRLRLTSRKHTAQLNQTPKQLAAWGFPFFHISEVCLGRSTRCYTTRMNEQKSTYKQMAPTETAPSRFSVTNPRFELYLLVGAIITLVILAAIEVLRSESAPAEPGTRQVSPQTERIE